MQKVFQHHNFLCLSFIINFVGVFVLSCHCSSGEIVYIIGRAQSERIKGGYLTADNDTINVLGMRKYRILLFCVPLYVSTIDFTCMPTPLRLSTDAMISADFLQSVRRTTLSWKSLLMTNFLVLLKCAYIIGGTECVTPTGQRQMQLLPVSSLNCLLLVRLVTHNKLMNQFGFFLRRSSSVF